MNCNSTEACYLPSSVTVQSGPGQIAPPLIMLLFLACRHNWNKAPPPSTLDGWECCLLSKTMVDYLASRLLYVTFDIIRDNSSQQLLLFEQLLSHSPYNNSTTTLWIRHSLVSLQCDRGVQRPIKVNVKWLNCDPTNAWLVPPQIFDQMFSERPFSFWLHQSILSLELKNRMVLVKILDFCHHS